MEENIDSASVQIDSPWGNKQFISAWGWTDSWKQRTKESNLERFCCGEWKLIVLIYSESSLFLLLGSYHANNISAQVKLCHISTFNPRWETFISVEKYTHAQIINVSPFSVLHVSVCVCALNLEDIYLRSAEVMGFGSCVILFDLLLTYDEFCCTSNLKKMNVDLRLQCHIFCPIDTSAAAPLW